MFDKNTDKNNIRVEPYSNINTSNENVVFVVWKTLK